MKKYIRTGLGAVKVGMISGLGGAMIGKMGGDMGGINALNQMMPVAIGASMTKNVITDFRKIKRFNKK